MESIHKANQDENGHQIEDLSAAYKQLIDDLEMDITGDDYSYNGFGGYARARLHSYCREKAEEIDNEAKIFIDEAIKNNLGLNEIKTQMKVFEDKYMGMLTMLRAKNKVSDADINEANDDDIENDQPVDDESINVDNKEAVHNKIDEVDSADKSENDESSSGDAYKAPLNRSQLPTFDDAYKAPRLPRFVLYEEPDPAGKLDINMIMDLVGGSIEITPRPIAERYVVPYADMDPEDALKQFIADCIETKSEDADDSEENKTEAEEIF